MTTRKYRELAAHRRDALSFCASKILLLLLAGSLFSISGCAKKYSPPPENLPAPQVVALPLQKRESGMRRPSNLVSSSVYTPIKLQAYKAGNRDVIAVARRTIGIPYRYGGTTPSTGFDCSGLVCWSFNQLGVSVPRTAQAQFNYGIRVAKSDLQPGDIVIFKGTSGGSGWHCGLYTGNGKFLHSPRTGKTVTETNLNSPYFSARYVGARRIPRDGTEKQMYASYHEKERRAANAALEKKREADAERDAVKPSKKAAHVSNTLAEARGKKAQKATVETQKKSKKDKKEQQKGTAVASAKKKDKKADKNKNASKKTEKATADATKKERKVNRS